MDKDIQIGIQTFAATEQALKTIMANWSQYWTYGTSGGDVQSDMFVTASAFYNEAKNMLERLQKHKAEWENGKVCTEPHQNPHQLHKCAKCGDIFNSENEIDTLCNMCHFMKTGVNKSEIKHDEHYEDELPVLNGECAKCNERFKIQFYGDIYCPLCHSQKYGQIKWDGKSSKPT